MRELVRLVRRPRHDRNLHGCALKQKKKKRTVESQDYRPANVRIQYASYQKL